MTIASSIRSTVRKEISKYGISCSLYSFSDVTKTTNEEGEDNITAWGTPSTIKVVSSDHQSFKRLIANMGIESDEKGRGFLVRDDVTIAAKDKLIVNSVAYEVISIKKIDPIQDINIAYKIMVARNEAYS